LKGHHAWEDDVRDVLAHIDPQGTEARCRGPDKRQKGGEFITPGPDFHQGAYNVKPMGSKKLVTFMAMLDASDN
jgi:hypothetical protein